MGPCQEGSKKFIPRAAWEIWEFFWENCDSQATKALIKNLALDALRIYISYTLTKFQVSSIRNEKALGFWARPKREKTLFFAFFHFQSCAHTMDGTQSAWCLLQKDVQHMWLYGSSTGQAMPCSWWEIWDFPLGNVNFLSNNSLDHTFVAPRFEACMSWVHTQNCKSLAHGTKKLQAFCWDHAFLCSTVFCELKEKFSTNLKI